METAIALFVFGIVFSIIGWLLSNKDKRQGEEIAKLFLLHDEDSKELRRLEREIDKDHYPKSELDIRFDKFDASVKEGFKSLSADIKELTKTLHDHVKEHRANEQ